MDTYSVCPLPEIAGLDSCVLLLEEEEELELDDLFEMIFPRTDAPQMGDLVAVRSDSFSMKRRLPGDGVLYKRTIQTILQRSRCSKEKRSVQMEQQDVLDLFRNNAPLMRPALAARLTANWCSLSQTRIPHFGESSVCGDSNQSVRFVMVNARLGRFATIGMTVHFKF